MKVRAIRGSIMYDGTVYSEGSEFEIQALHLPQIQENVEVLDGAVKPSAEETPREEAPHMEEQSSEEESEVSAMDYSKMKKEELLQLAKERGIEVPSKAKTAEIIELLEGAQ